MTSTLMFVIVTFLAVSCEAAHPNENGISGYCKKSQSGTLSYVPTPIECCNAQGKCAYYIGPQQTKYGLTNPDPNWPRRLCSCDQQLFECVTKGLDPETKKWVRNYSMSQEICFQRIQSNRNTRKKTYEFVNFVATI